jgi:hypothetical protein
VPSMRLPLCGLRRIAHPMGAPVMPVCSSKHIQNKTRLNWRVLLPTKKLEYHPLPGTPVMPVCSPKPDSDKKIALPAIFLWCPQGDNQLCGLRRNHPLPGAPVMPVCISKPGPIIKPQLQACDLYPKRTLHPQGKRSSHRCRGKETTTL